MNFLQYQNMIQKLAHKVSRLYQVEYEDMEAQGYLIYCECLQNYEITKASFSTYLYINLVGRLKSYALTVSRQKGIALYDLLNDDISDLDEDTSALLSTEDDNVTQQELLDEAKKCLSHDSYIILKWIISRTWERKGKHKPSINTVVELFGWNRIKVKKCWDECKNFWLNEGIMLYG